MVHHPRRQQKRRGFSSGRPRVVESITILLLEGLLAILGVDVPAAPIAWRGRRKRFRAGGHVVQHTGTTTREQEVSFLETSSVSAARFELALDRV